MTTNTPTAGGASGTYNDTVISLAITPSSVANAIRVTTLGGSVKTTSGLAAARMRLTNFTQTTIVGPATQVYANARPSDTADDMYFPAQSMQGIDFPSSVAAQTYKVQITNAGAVGAVTYPDGFSIVPFVTLLLEELMT
jgi:hypothetical protein